MAWVPAQLPYLKPPNLLPDPLPIGSRFFESTAVFRDDTSYHRVVAVEPHFTVKYGRGVKEIEGQVLLFLEHHLEACHGLPKLSRFRKLYAMYRIASTGHVCLIMQRMPGVSLNQLWPTLKDFEKSDICTQLNEIATSIRSIPAPSLYRSIDQGRFHHYLCYSSDADKEICGPFDSKTTSMRHCFKADFYEKNLGRTLVGHKPGLTVSLVDWEEAGWFPAYWEYFTALQGVQWDDDWSQRIEDIMEPWVSEAAVMKMVHQDLIF
ncbi:hypothetical protein BU25DRAFT_413871 [Macroventuria anomochaeta]|uniref:Uncharacterized protein n=1 Tax=Macroventuria anomochaeta TaxID=301207 RepID=A0ACB6RRF8_9PLEO|nr:uncharacterized protein BU25DRAFT_413871 [Macroventuria anomochaeta]KAF2623980.1 hypothetical protein BU25DRAFT_413871 [Macroventuria anomochaeta]